MSHFDDFYVRLFSNQLTTIPARAFENISSVTDLHIELYNNQIFEIDSQAFIGVEDSLYDLDLHNNNLTHIPTALNQLTHLHDLYLRGNPITLLDATVLSNIGRTLNVFDFDLDRFLSFPPELHFLKNLTVLTINKMPFSRLPDNALHGQDLSLLKLDVSYSNLTLIPIGAVCTMGNLHTLVVDSNMNLQDKEPFIFERCHHNMTSMLELSLMRNNLTVFPSAFALFPNLERLFLSHNNLCMIENSSVPYNATLNYLDLGVNKFIEIPSAINKLLNLEHLDFRYNQITSIRTSQLNQLHKLRYLYLTGNPLVYISANVFQFNPELVSVDFGNTNITHIPQAIASVKNLNYFYIGTVSVRCSCDSLSFLKAWNVTSLLVGPRCNNGEPVKSFVMTTLPYCP